MGVFNVGGTPYTPPRPTESATGTRAELLLRV